MRTQAPVQVALLPLIHDDGQRFPSSLLMLYIVIKRRRLVSSRKLAVRASLEPELEIKRVVFNACTIPGGEQRQNGVRDEVHYMYLREGNSQHCWDGIISR